MAAEEDAASCPVCQEIYSDPRCLLCGHSFCLKCLQRLADHRKNFRCPICRFRVNLGDGKVDQLPKNYVLCNVIEAKDKTYPSMCLKHNKLLDIFCEECDMVICSKCLSMQHKGHVIEDIDKIFNERNETLAAFLANTKLSVSMIQEKRNVIEQSRNAMQKHADSIHNTVDNMFKEWYNALHAQQNAVLSYLEQERDKKIQVYDEAESILTSSMTNVTELETEINKTRSKDMAFVVQQYGSIRARHEDTGRKVLLDLTTCFTPPDDLKLEVCAPWIEEAIDNIKPTDMKQTEAQPQVQKISEIQKENNFLKRDLEQLEYENKFLRTLLSDLHEYGTCQTEAEGSIFEKPITIKPDSPVTTQYQQAQDIYNNMKEMERDLEQLEYENKFLRTLLSDLHEYGTCQTEAEGSIFEKPITVKPDSPVATQYQQAQDIYNNMKEMESTNDTYKQKNEQLQKSVEDMYRCLFEEEKRVSALKKKIQRIEWDLGSANTENRQLQNTNDMYQQKNKQLQMSVDHLTRRLSWEEERVSQEKETVSVLKCLLGLLTMALISYFFWSYSKITTSGSSSSVVAA